MNTVASIGAGFHGLLEVEIFMKRPQQKFVLEYKSGRRQQKARANSIWGDADLKALAREVEDNAPHLFNSSEAPGMPDKGRDIAPDLIKSGSDDQSAGDVEVAPTTIPSIDGADVEIAKQSHADVRAAEATTQVQDKLSESQARTRSRDSARKSTKRTPSQVVEDMATGTNDDRNVYSDTAEDLVFFEELAALEAENKRLKGLLAEQLHIENLQLKKMLARFDIT